MVKKKELRKSQKMLRDLVEDKAAMLSCALCGFKTRDPKLWNDHLWACG